MNAPRKNLSNPDLSDECTEMMTTADHSEEQYQFKRDPRLGDSAGSLGYQSLLEDHVSPPETTRPEPSIVTTNRVTPWKTQASLSSEPTSLASVMKDQLREQASQKFDSVVAQQIEQEEEILLAMAMERSLAELSYMSLHSTKQGITSTSSHRSLARTDSGNAQYTSKPAAIDSQSLFLKDTNEPSVSETPEFLMSNTLSQPTSLRRGSIEKSYDLTGAADTLSPDELREIQNALEEAEMTSQKESNEADELAHQIDGISVEDAAAIQAAIRQAEQEEEEQKQEMERQSLLLALEIQRREDEEARQILQRRQQQPQGNVRTMTREELERESRVGAYTLAEPAPKHLLEDDDREDARLVAAGFRINAAAPHEWNRRGDHVVGPDNEIRTKHDIELNDIANAHRLGLDNANIGNKAYNSFRASLKKNQTKGVAAHGTGRAGSDADATKNGVMDPQVRVLISKAINSGIISRCNGIVKEGKEAVVCHADMGNESESFDVAVKVFKRISEFKARADYVQGDPRYARDNFRKLSSRDQLSLWAEKEYRNLVRANRCGVPVPTPLMHKDNVLFMRFLGHEGWPAPQLRELNLRRASKRWEVLYSQVMEAVKNLYQRAKLVHGDLSEYNIMIVPAYLVENIADGIEDINQDVQAALIDFGQAVDARHPDADGLLERDIARVNTFFSLQGVETMSQEMSLRFVTGGGKDEEPSHLEDHADDSTGRISPQSQNEPPDTTG
jgi:serine/threonine-protein kinase RIO1